jgi:cytochrome c55X
MGRRVLAAAALIVVAVLLAPPRPAAAQTADGKSIFEANCLPCHGADLSGGVGKPLNAGSEAADKSDAELTSIITNGVPGTPMPAWGEKLSPEEIAAVLGYIRSVESGTAVTAPAASASEGPSARFPWGLAFIVSAAVVLSAGLIVMVVNPGVGTFTWRQAYARGFVVFFYFFLLTVWLPSTMFTERPISTAPKLVQDIVVSGAWFTMLAVGLAALYFLQKAKRI